MDDIRCGTSYEKNSISKLLLELKKSMVGVPRGALGSRPVLSELAGVYGVLLHGAPDGDALAQLPVEPLQVYRGGDASIEDIDTVVVGGRGASRTGIVHATDPIADGFTARAFTLRTQGLSDQADALEALVEHVASVPSPAMTDALTVLLALSDTDGNDGHASAVNRDPLPLGRAARAVLAQQRARNQTGGRNNFGAAAAADVALPAQPERFFANSFLLHRSVNADLLEHRSHFGDSHRSRYSTGRAGVGTVSDNAGQVNDQVGNSSGSSSSSGDPCSHHDHKASTLAPLPLPPSLTSGTSAFGMFPNHMFESGLGNIGAPPLPPPQSHFESSTVDGSVIDEHEELNDDHHRGNAFDDDQTRDDSNGSDGSRDHLEDDMDLRSERAGSSLHGRSERQPIEDDRRYTTSGSTSMPGASHHQPSYQGIGIDGGSSSQRTRRTDGFESGNGHGRASSGGGIFGSAGEGLDLNLFAALPGAGLSSVLTSGHRNEPANLAPPPPPPRHQANAVAVPASEGGSLVGRNSEFAPSATVEENAASLAPVSDLFGALHHRPVSMATHAFRHLDVELALPELPEPPFLGFHELDNNNDDEAGNARNSGNYDGEGGGDGGEGGGPPSHGASENNHDERSVDSWGVYRDALGTPGSTFSNQFSSFARPASLTARALAHHTARSGSRSRSYSSSHLIGANSNKQEEGEKKGFLSDTRSEVSRGSIKSQALSAAASQSARRQEAAFLHRGFAVPASGWDRALARATATASATVNGACPSESSHVSAFSGGIGIAGGGGASVMDGGGATGIGGCGGRNYPQEAPALAPPPLVSQAGLEAFETCYRAFADHSLAAPPQVLPAATVAGLAMQALTGTPSPPFLDFQPALIPSISQSNSSSHGERGEGSSEWTCNNWRLEVAPTAAVGCRFAGCSALATKNALREFALAGTAAHRVGCFVRCFALSNADLNTHAGSNNTSASSHSSNNGQIIAAVAAAAGTLLEGYRMEILALAEAWQLKKESKVPLQPSKSNQEAEPRGTASAAHAASPTARVPNSLAAMLTATRSLRRGMIRLAQLLGCGAHLQAPLSAAGASASASNSNIPAQSQRGGSVGTAAAATAPTPSSALLSSSSLLSVAGPTAVELRVIFQHFPRGPTLLSYLYSQAALEHDNDSDHACFNTATTAATVGADAGVGAGSGASVGSGNAAGKLATSLFVAGLKPYLALCSKWLFASEPLSYNQDEAGEFPLSEVVSVFGGLSPEALGSADDGGSQFFQRTFVGRTMSRLASNPRLPEAAAAAASSSDPTLLPLTKISIAGEPNRHHNSSNRSKELAADNALTQLLPSFLRHHTAGLALLRTGMVLRLVLAANSSHDGLLPPSFATNPQRHLHGRHLSGNHHAQLALDLSPFTRASSRVLCRAINLQVANTQQAHVAQRRAVNNAAAAMIIQQKRAAKLRVAKREAQRLEEEMAASKARRAKQEAHRATLEAHLADTKKRRADAAAEAQKAEVAAQEATAARRAALESEALEALLDKYSVLEKGAEARLQHAKRLLKQLDDDATRTLDAKAAADRALSSLPDSGTTATNSSGVSDIARRHARLTARLAMASSIGGGARTEADAYATLVQEQRQKRRLRSGNGGGLRMPGGNSTATATLLAPGGALGAPDASVGSQINQRTGQAGVGRHDVGGTADGARQAMYGYRVGDSKLQEHASSVKVSGNGMGGGSAEIGKVMYGYDDDENRRVHSESTVKVIGNGMGGGGKNAQRAMYGNGNGNEDEDPVKSQASVKVAGNGMGGSGIVDHARQALYGYQEGDERVHEDSSVKVLGNGMGGGSEGIHKVLYGYDDDEERVRAAPSVKVAGDGAEGGGDGARIAMYGNADGSEESYAKSQASIKVAGNGMGGSGTVDHARRALYGYQEGDERVHGDSSVKVLGNGMGGGSEGIHKALYGYDDGEGREKVKASTLSVKISAKGLGGGESTSVDRHAASVKVRGDGMGGKKRDQNGVADHQDIFHGNQDGQGIKFKPSVKVSGRGVGSDGASAAKSLYGQQDTTQQYAPGWVDDEKDYGVVSEGGDLHGNRRSNHFFSAEFTAPAANGMRKVSSTGQSFLPWGLPQSGNHTSTLPDKEGSLPQQGASFLDAQWANALGSCRRQPSFAAAVQSLLGVSSATAEEEGASLKKSNRNNGQDPAQFVNSERSPPLQLLVEECVFEPILHAAAAADRAAVALMLRGKGSNRNHSASLSAFNSSSSSSDAQIERGAILGKHLGALHTLMLAGQGSGATFFELADRLLERFGDVSRSELLFFKQSLPSPVLPPATAATAAAAAAVVASQARQARHAKATAAAAAISTTADLSRSINAVSGNNYGDESSMRSDDFVGRVLTSLLVEAAQANHLGLDSRKGGAEVVVGDVENGPDSAAVFTANVDGSRSCMDSASLKRYAFVPSEMVPSSVSAATATTTTTLLGDVLTKALPGLLGQAQSLRCRYSVPWPLGVLIDEYSMATYEAAHAKLLAHHLCLAMLRKTFQVLSLTSSALDDHCHRFGRSGFGASSSSSSSSSSSPTQRTLANARQQLHCLHLLRHQLFFVANSLTDHFAFEIESAWDYLRGVLDEDGDDDDDNSSSDAQQDGSESSDSESSESEIENEVIQQPHNDKKDEEAAKTIAVESVQGLTVAAASTATADEGKGLPNAVANVNDDADVDAGTDGEDAADDLAHAVAGGSGSSSSSLVQKSASTSDEVDLSTALQDTTLERNVKPGGRNPPSRPPHVVSAKRQAQRQARASAKHSKQNQQRAAKKRAKLERAAARAARCPPAHNLQDLKNAHDGYLKRVRSALFLAPATGRDSVEEEEPSAAALRAEVSRFHALVSSVHAAIASLNDSLNQIDIDATTANPSQYGSPTSSSSPNSSSTSTDAAAADHHQKVLSVAQAVSDAFAAIHGGAPRVLGQPAAAATHGGSNSSSSSSAAVAEHALGSSGQQLARLVVRFCDALHNARSNRCFGTSRHYGNNNTGSSLGSQGAGSNGASGRFNFFDSSGLTPMGGMGGGPAAGLAYSALAVRLGDFFLQSNKGK